MFAGSSSTRSTTFCSAVMLLSLSDSIQVRRQFHPASAALPRIRTRLCPLPAHPCVPSRHVHSPSPATNEILLPTRRRWTQAGCASDPPDVPPQPNRNSWQPPLQEPVSLPA